MHMESDFFDVPSVFCGNGNTAAAYSGTLTGPTAAGTIGNGIVAYGLRFGRSQ